MREYRKWDHEVRLFDSVSDLMEAVKAVPDRKCKEATAYRNPKRTDRPFDSWDEVYQAAMSPWQSGVEQVERMTAALRDVDLPHPVCRMRRIKWSGDDGDEVDRDRLSAGQDYWRASHRPYVSGEQVVTIVIDLNAMWTVDAASILWRGAAALAMTEVLEEAGFRIELWAVHRADKAYTDGTGHFHAVKLKDAQDPLDTSTLVAAVSGWFYRSVMQRAKFISMKEVTKIKGFPSEPLSLVDELGAVNPVVISGAYSFNGALTIAREALQKLSSPAPVEEPPDEEPVEEVKVAAPEAPPKPLTPAQQVKQLKERERAQKRLEKWRKEWEKSRRED